MILSLKTLIKGHKFLQSNISQNINMRPWDGFFGMTSRVENMKFGSLQSL
jgi:hypothetical protein